MLEYCEAVRAVRPVGPAIMGVLVGNKNEFRDGTIDSRAEVRMEDAQKLANDLGLRYFECSAVSSLT